MAKANRHLPSSSVIFRHLLRLSRHRLNARGGTRKLSYLSELLPLGLQLSGHLAAQRSNFGVPPLKFGVPPLADLGQIGVLLCYFGIPPPDLFFNRQ